MWMMTRYGMYSIVNNPDDPEFEVQIRARVKEDLEALQHRFGALMRPYDIIETPRADYACRIIMPQHEFSLLAFQLASDIDYTNFKGEVERTNPGRAVLYHRVWALLLNTLQPTSHFAWPQSWVGLPVPVRGAGWGKKRKNRKKRLKQLTSIGR